MIKYNESICILYSSVFQLQGEVGEGEVLVQFAHAEVTYLINHSIIIYILIYVYIRINCVYKYNKYIT